MDKRDFAGKLELKLLDTGTTQEKLFSGYAAVFNNIDAYGDIIAPGAFTRTLAEHKSAGTMPALLWNHDALSMPVGVWSALEEDANGLKAEGAFVDTQGGRDAYVLAKTQAVTGLSIGYQVSGFEMSTVGGVTVRTITEIKLYEISLVTFPANDLARVEDVKNQENEVSEEIKPTISAKEASDYKKEIRSMIDKCLSEWIAIKSADDSDDEDCDCDEDDDACDCDEEQDSEDVAEEKSAISAIDSLLTKMRGQWQSNSRDDHK